ncbi:hypothetical protein L226DRAFT_101906 [Lentinus tigrinus ALCF2SS1-7]|uniref:F-box domain-containing protein n=1 Tax=Lentinus tigrinus ALCF2SS1-6 TaxID=1328759 RepID=A0A5C2S7V0_9APHY|nr:hypothetical protein L227DRAFT_612194 [Lentinus tigrinus ALCF2SS1-6]RPD73536.1 hypothetical protein L226DRAFT_101906 [Lentinus tigrinus ALCF2SS1-7]
MSRTLLPSSSTFRCRKISRIDGHIPSDPPMRPASIDLTSVGTPTEGTIRLEDLRRLDLPRMPYGDLHNFVDDRLVLLESSIEAIQEVCVRLRELRNAHTQASCIPPELLTRIFSYLVARDIDLVRATHVCHKWRQVALDSSCLWTRVTVTNVEKAEAYITRSRLQLVDVFFESSSNHVVRRFSRLLKPLAHRLRTLVVEGSDASTVSYFMSALHYLPVPHLETLHLIGSVASDSDRRAVDVSKDGRKLFVTRYEDRVSFAHCPALRSLRLHPIGLSWDTDVYRGLTVLELRVPQMHHPSQKRILEILKQCPGLESLHLDLPALAHPTIPDSSWNISLPSLSMCTLVSLPPDNVAAILSHLTLPATTRFEIFTSEHARIGPTPSYAVLPRNRSRLAGVATIHTIEILILKRVLRLNCFHPRIWSLEEPVLILNLSLQSHAEDALSALPLNFDVSELEILVVAYLNQVTADDMWSDIFHRAQKLRTLRLVGLSSLAVASVFKELRTQQQPMIGHPQCSALTDIELVDVSFRQAWLVAELLGCVEKRMEIGFPLKRLELLDCDIPEGLVECLNALGVEIFVNED